MMLSYRKKMLGFIVFIVVCIYSVPALAETHVVPLDYETIQRAVGAAADGDEIQVLPGTYSELMGPAVTLYGRNLKITGDPENPSSTVINIQGNFGLAQAFYILDSSVTIEGFTIKNGFTEWEEGSAVHAWNSNLTLRNNIITENISESAPVVLVGFNNSVIENNVISDNLSYSTSPYSGAMAGAILVEQLGSPPGNLTIKNNIIRDNSTLSERPASSSAGGIVIIDYTAPVGYGARVSIAGNIIDNAGLTLSDNLTVGGIFIGGVGNAYLTNNQLSHLTGYWVGGILCEHSNCQLANNTIAYCSGEAYGALLLDHCDRSEILNSIFWENSLVQFGNEMGIFGCGYVVVSNSIIEGGLENNPGYYPSMDGGGNLSADPMFVSSNNLSLSNFSPAIDAGLSINAPQTDIFGYARFNDLGVSNTGIGSPNYTDIGAYEKQTHSRLAPPPRPCGSKKDWSCLPDVEVQEQEASANMK